MVLRRNVNFAITRVVQIKPGREEYASHMVPRRKDAAMRGVQIASLKEEFV
jgi:hypothetical protein